MVFATLKYGLMMALRHKRMLLVYYLTSLVAGLIVMAPMRARLAGYLDGSLAGERLAGSMDMDFLFEFLINGGGITPILVLALVVAAGYFLGQLFLSGGAFAIFWHNEGYSGERFWGQAGVHFGRFVRLALLVGLFGGLGFGVIRLLLGGLEHLVGGSDPYESTQYWFRWATTIAHGFWLMIVYIVLDYARILTVVSGERRMLMAFGAALGFVARHLRRTVTLIFVFGPVMSTIMTLLYKQLANLLHHPHWLAVLAFILLMQGYMIFRAMLKLGLFAAEVQLFRSVTDPGYRASLTAGAPEPR